MEIWQLTGDALRQALRERWEENAKAADMDWKTQQRLRELDKLRKSGMGDRLIDKEFASFVVKNTSKETRAAYHACIDFAHNIDKQTKGLMLFGKPGTGKTHLAAAINHYLTTQLYPVVFSNITQIIGAIKKTYSGGDITEYDLLQEFNKPKLLIIDDLGKENATENTRSLIYQLLNARYESGGLLVVTTNMTSDEIRQRLGEATLSRLAEMCRLFPMIGEDRRLKHD